eukprot:4569319-Lingulodinium_polyedra.AAC.1
MHDGAQGQRAAAGRRAHYCHDGFGERREKEATQRYCAMMCPDTRCNTDGTEVRQETAADMVLEPLRGHILWAGQRRTIQGAN